MTRPPVSPELIAEIAERMSREDPRIAKAFAVTAEIPIDGEGMRDLMVGAWMMGYACAFKDIDEISHDVPVLPPFAVRLLAAFP